MAFLLRWALNPGLTYQSRMAYLHAPRAASYRIPAEDLRSAWINGLISKASNGKHSLDGVVLHILRRLREGKAATPEDFVKKVIELTATTDAEIQALYHDMTTGGIKSDDLSY